MKKVLIIALCISSVIAISSCSKKTKSTGHLVVTSDFSALMTQKGVPSNARVYASCNLDAAGFSNTLAVVTDSTSAPSSKTFDFGELNASDYSIEIIGAYAISGSNFYSLVLTGQGGGQSLQIQAGKDQTIQLTP